MNPFSRRNFLGSTAAAMPLALASSGNALGAGNYSSPPYASMTAAAQIEREQTWAFFRELYEDFNSGDLQRFMPHFAQSDKTVFQDATLNFSIQGISGLTAAFGGLFTALARTLGPGNIARLSHVSGDLRYGAVIEQVSLKNSFFATNGITDQRVFDLDSGLVARMTDYSDSRELGESDIVGPANTQGVAAPSGPLHPGGTPKSSTTPAAPGSLALTTGVTGKPSASPEMIEFAQRFHAAMREGNMNHILSFFTEDAVYINPLIHQGPALYGNFDQTIQIQGMERIARLFFAIGSALPDGVGSSLIHIVGGQSGGGFEWKAGGQYSKTGINRSGLNGSTALDLFNGRIQRMSVKFDTFQLPTTAYDSIRSRLAVAGLVDQGPS